jgi:hypothetical protein
MSDRQSNSADMHSSNRHRSRSRNREHDTEQPHRQLQPCTRAVAAVEAAYASHPRSISRLHDDELSYVFSFLELEDLAQLVRCNRRFNDVARKERSRGVHLEGDASIVPPFSSTLSHHATSLHLVSDSDAPISLDTLRQWRGLPHLTALQFKLRNADDVDHFMQGLSLTNAAAALRAVLPTRLRSFSVVVGSTDCWLNERTAVLASSFLAAVDDMTGLTELRVEQHTFNNRMYVRSELAGLPHLRKLTLGPAGWWGEFVAELKQLSQLRELILLDNFPDRIHLLCQPPHALQLESLSLPLLYPWVDAELMGALLHLPTLTSLELSSIIPEAYPLLPQLLLLRRLPLRPYYSLTPSSATSLCAALSRCAALEDFSLYFFGFAFKTLQNEALTAEPERVSWAALLSSVPNVRRLCINCKIDALVPVLPFHLPRLEELSLGGWRECAADLFPSIAHPNLRLLELVSDTPPPPSEEDVRAWMGSDRLPKLERYHRASHYPRGMDSW